MSNGVQSNDYLINTRMTEGSEQCDREMELEYLHLELGVLNTAMHSSNIYICVREW